MKNVNQEINWCGVPLNNRLMLAPMAGFTEITFRKLAEEYGASLTCTELVSARGICYDTEFEKNRRYLRIAGQTAPVAIQLFGADPDDMGTAVKRVLAHPEYGQCAMIDLNMGCPVDKVVKTGAGAALMKNPDLACLLTEAAVKAALPFGKQVSVKIRSGWDSNHVNAPVLAARLAEAGAAAITVHARTREQFYSGEADKDIIALCAEGLPIPLAANGDLKDIEDCHYVLNECGAAACMIGRVANGNPWVFRELLLGREAGRPDRTEWLRVVRLHLAGLIETLGEYSGIREFRSSLSAYIKGMSGASALRRQLMQIDDRKELEKLLEEIARF